MVQLRHRVSGREVGVKVGWSWILFLFSPVFGLPLAWRGLWGWAFFVLGLYVVAAASLASPGIRVGGGGVGGCWGDEECLAMMRGWEDRRGAEQERRGEGRQDGQRGLGAIPRTNPEQEDSASFDLTLGDAKVSGSLEWDPILTDAAQSFAARAERRGGRGGRGFDDDGGSGLGFLAVLLVLGLAIAFGVKGSALTGRHLLENGFRFAKPDSDEAKSARAAWGVDPTDEALGAVSRTGA